MFISDAFAQTAKVASQTQGSPDWMSVIFQFALIFLVLYLLFIRPQQKKFKEHENALNSIKVGSKIVVGGLLGEVKGINDDKLDVEISKGVQITVFRAYVSQVLNEKK